MKLYLLKARLDLPNLDNPWEPWWNKCFNVVVEAISNAAARKLANTEYHITTFPTAWLESRYSICEVLKPIGKQRIIIADEKLP